MMLWTCLFLLVLAAAGLLPAAASSGSNVMAPVRTVWSSWRGAGDFVFEQEGYFAQ